jgi:hypothetical protein
MGFCLKESGLASMFLLVTKLQCVNLAHVCLQNVCVPKIGCGGINDFRFFNCLYLMKEWVYLPKELKALTKVGITIMKIN